MALPLFNGNEGAVLRLWAEEGRERRGLREEGEEGWQKGEGGRQKGEEGGRTGEWGGWKQKGEEEAEREGEGEGDGGGTKKGEHLSPKTMTYKMCTNW